MFFKSTNLDSRYPLIALIPETRSWASTLSHRSLRTNELQVVVSSQNDSENGKKSHAHHVQTHVNDHMLCLKAMDSRTSDFFHSSMI